MKVESTEVEISALIQDLGAQGISERIVLGAFQKGVEFALNKRIHKPQAPAILVEPLLPRGHKGETMTEVQKAICPTPTNYVQPAEPDGFDGHDYEGFPGGCERMACTQEQPKPPKAPPEVRQLLMTQGEIQKLRLLVSQEVAYCFEEAEELKEDAQFYKAEGCKEDAKASWNHRAKVIRRANSWTDIQKTLKTGGDTPAEVIAAMNARGYTIAKIK